MSSENYYIQDGGYDELYNSSLLRNCSGLYIILTNLYDLWNYYYPSNHTDEKIRA